MSTVDPEIADEIRATLEANGVRVHTETAVAAIERDWWGLDVHAKSGDGDRSRSWQAAMVLVATGVRRDTELAASAGLTLGVRGAIAVDRRDAHQPAERVRRRGLRTHISPASRPPRVPAARLHRT
jgi:pyruvate/2-oxoglutarate dehydrogenase complex dihydrolipoamide dehydrogenase (E3) component